MRRITRYLSVTQVVGLYYQAMAFSGQRPAALMRPQALENVVNHHPSLDRYGERTHSEKAVDLANGIVYAHPWKYGNRRCAFISMVTFLELNGVSVLEPAVQRYMTVAHRLVEAGDAAIHMRDTRIEEWIEELREWERAAERS
jgi:prophage maintenance system killer protein